MFHPWYDDINTLLSYDLRFRFSDKKLQPFGVWGMGAIFDLTKDNVFFLPTLNYGAGLEYNVSRKSTIKLEVHFKDIVFAFFSVGYNQRIL